MSRQLLQNLPHAAECIANIVAQLDAKAVTYPVADIGQYRNRRGRIQLLSLGVPLATIGRIIRWILLDLRGRK